MANKNMNTTVSDPILQVQDLSKRFGGLTAVDHLSFEIEAESTTGLIGPNGAGKTTVFNLINGMLEPDGGRVVYGGEDITTYSTPEIANVGVGRTFQDSELFPSLTVLENLQLASSGGSGQKRAEELLELIELTEKRDNVAMNLSYGQSKLVGIARAFMLEPDLVLLDEPLSGINPSLQSDVLKMANRLQEEYGTTYLIIEHDMEVIMSACDRILVMESGSILSDGEPSDIQEDEQVKEAYFGKEVL